MISQTGNDLDDTSIEAIGREISWVPTKIFHFPSSEDISVADRVKSYVENVMGETGTFRHVDLPEQAAEELQVALRSAPAFIDSLEQHNQPLNGNFPISARISRPLRSPASDTAKYSAPQYPIPSPPQSASQHSANLPLSTSSSATLNAGIGSSHQPWTGSPSNALPMSDPRWIYMRIETCGSYHFSSLRSDHMKADIEFFSTFKSEYLRGRGPISTWFSMWRYDGSYYPCHTWCRYQHRRKFFGQVNTTAIESLPKRRQGLEMHDGKREIFWGIYAREHRCFAWVLGSLGRTRLSWDMKSGLSEVVEMSQCDCEKQEAFTTDPTDEKRDKTKPINSGFTIAGKAVIPRVR
nr:hypothetical protein CFP56_09547 [Quercus suber]